MMGAASLTELVWVRMISVAIGTAILLQWPIEVDRTDATFLVLYVQLIVQMVELCAVFLCIAILGAIPHTLVWHLMMVWGWLWRFGGLFVVIMVILLMLLGLTVAGLVGWDVGWFLEAARATDASLVGLVAQVLECFLRRWKTLVEANRGGWSLFLLIGLLVSDV